ncbi:MAG: hypothetical protein ACI89R_000203 [Candidatus Azotimanducaceae bacterium]|jgi:hypothetical protein
MMKKIPFSLSVLVFTLFLLISVETFSQGPPPPPPPGLVPIDGGILLLLTSGLIYGVSKLRDKS